MSIGITTVSGLDTLFINGIVSVMLYPFTHTKITSGERAAPDFTAFSKPFISKAFTAFVYSLLSRLRVMPFSLRADRFLPLAIRVVSIPAFVRYAAIAPPVPPTPITRYFTVFKSFQKYNE